MITRVLHQTPARVIGGDTHVLDKVLSLFEPHTEAIRKGKAVKPTEFGKLVTIQESEHQIVTASQVHDHRPTDKTLWVPGLDTHIALFGRAPDLATADRGFSSAANEAAATARGVRRVALPHAGHKSPARRAHEKQRWFRRAACGRVVSEGRISVLKHRHGLHRSRYRGRDGTARWVGLGVIANNLRGHRRLSTRPGDALRAPPTDAIRHARRPRLRDIGCQQRHFFTEKEISRSRWVRPPGGWRNSTRREGRGLEAHRRELRVGDAAPLRMDLKIESAAYAQPRGRRGRVDQVHDRLMRDQRLATPILGDEREEAMFDLVPLAGAGRQVTGGDRRPDVIGERLHIELPEAQPIAVASAAIGRDEERSRGRIPPPPHLPPPGAQALHRELGRVMAHADTHPRLVAVKIEDAIRGRAPQGLVDEVVDLHVDRIAGRLQLAPIVLVGPDEFALLVSTETAGSLAAI